VVLTEAVSPEMPPFVIHDTQDVFAIARDSDPPNLAGLCNCVGGEVLKRSRLLTVINAKIDENLFGEAFSEECPDGGNRSIGCNLEKLIAAYKVIWPARQAR
jgi:hypothetical protein